MGHLTCGNGGSVSSAFGFSNGSGVIHKTERHLLGFMSELVDINPSTQEGEDLRISVLGRGALRALVHE